MNTPVLAREAATALRIVLEGLKSDKFGALVPLPPALDAPIAALEQLRDCSVLLRVLTNLDPVFFDFQVLETPDVGQEQSEWIWSRVTSRIAGWLSRHGYEEMVPSVDVSTIVSNRDFWEDALIDACHLVWHCFEAVAERDRKIRERKAGARAAPGFFRSVARVCGVAQDPVHARGLLVWTVSVEEGSQDDLEADGFVEAEDSSLLDNSAQPDELSRSPSFERLDETPVRLTWRHSVPCAPLIPPPPLVDRSAEFDPFHLALDEGERAGFASDVEQEVEEEEETSDVQQEVEEELETPDVEQEVEEEGETPNVRVVQDVEEEEETSDVQQEVEEEQETSDVQQEVAEMVEKAATPFMKSSWLLQRAEQGVPTPVPTPAYVFETNVFGFGDDDPVVLDFGGGLEEWREPGGDEGEDRFRRGSFRLSSTLRLSEFNNSGGTGRVEQGRFYDEIAPSTPTRGGSTSSSSPAVLVEPSPMCGTSRDDEAQGQGSISNRQILDPTPIEPTPRDPAAGGPALVLSVGLSAREAAEEELKGSYKMVLVKPKWANLDPSAPDVLEYRWVCSTCGTRGVRALVIISHLEEMQGKKGHPQRERRVTGKIRSKSFKRGQRALSNL